MPRVALSRIRSTVTVLVAPSSGLPPRSPVSPTLLAFPLASLVTCSSHSRHFKINLSFALARSHSAAAPLYSLQFGL